jgi:beta-lactamase class A
MKKNHLIQIGAVLGIALLGGMIGWFLRKDPANLAPQLIRQVRENSPKYHFINPLLFLETSKEKTPDYAPLEKELSKYVEQVTDAKQADSVSIYFRDVNSGRWTGINEDVTYRPSSMFKVAVMMGILKHATFYPSVLDRKLYYKETIDPGQFYKPEQPLKTGYYTVQELINAMILDSDNTATIILLQNYEKDYLDVLTTLRLPTPQTNDDFLSSKSYSVLFRSLYNATYLPASAAEQALTLLASTTFNNGLVEGVPENIIVSHKFGEQTNAFTNGRVRDRELHDCGIVYYPTRPYFICVMTKGQDFKQLEDVIQHISEITYKNIERLAGIKN